MEEQEIEKLEPFAQQRIRICKQCEHYRMFICSQCGCFMPAKTRLRNAKCPIDKWQAEPGTST